MTATKTTAAFNAYQGGYNDFERGYWPSFWYSCGGVILPCGVAGDEWTAEERSAYVRGYQDSNRANLAAGNVDPRTHGIKREMRAKGRDAVAERWLEKHAAR